MALITMAKAEALVATIAERMYRLGIADMSLPDQTTVARAMGTALKQAFCEHGLIDDEPAA
jgi:predicted glycosyltransferase